MSKSFLFIYLYLYLSEFEIYKINGTIFFIQFKNSLGVTKFAIPDNIDISQKKAIIIILLYTFNDTKMQKISFEFVCTLNSKCFVNIIIILKLLNTRFIKVRFSSLNYFRKNVEENRLLGLR